MADDAVLLNATVAPFVETEAETGEASVYPGSFVSFDADGDVTKISGDNATGNGIVVGLGFDPNVELDTAYTSGETVRAYHIPIGGEVQVRLAAGGDLVASADADVSEGDLLVETDLGAVANYDSTDTGGDPVGAVYQALEAVDNSSASAGVANQVYIEARRLA